VDVDLLVKNVKYMAAYAIKNHTMNNAHGSFELSLRYKYGLWPSQLVKMEEEKFEASSTQTKYVPKRDRQLAILLFPLLSISVVI
jgi:hypothetical protein